MVETFPPVNSNHYENLWLALILAVVGISVTILLSTKRRMIKLDRNRRQVLSMLTFFLALIAVGTALFSWVAYTKIAEIKVTEEAISTSYGVAKFENIVKAELKVDKPPALLNPGASTSSRNTRILLIEEKDNQLHVISEEDYKVEAIFASLKEAFDTWKQKN